MTPEALRHKLAGFPRLPYWDHPSPLRRLPRLERHFAACPALWIKRDDEVGLGLGGNKGRALAYLMAEAVQQGRRKVATYGGLQSNHARMTAAACAQLGLEAHLFFFQRRPPDLTGNLLLNQLMGAQMHFIPFGESDKAARTLETTIRLVRIISFCFTGPGTYFIPGGGHNVTGCLGYVETAVEIQEQVQALNLPQDKITVVTASGTGGTLAGLLAGFSLLDSPIQVLGIDIGRLWKDFPKSISHLANAAMKALDGQPIFKPETVPLIENGYAGSAYAKPHPPARAAMRLAAREEGIILDPVYTAKAFAGMLDMIVNNRFSQDELLIFLHTGGLPALWASSANGEAI